MGIYGKKKILFIMILLSFFLFAGCSEKSKDADSEFSEKDSDTEIEQVILNTASMFGGTDSNLKVYQQINKEFMKEHPYILLQDDSSASSQSRKTELSLAISSGKGPDVLQYFTDANATDLLKSDPFVTVEEIQKVYPEYAQDTLETALLATQNPDGVSRAIPTTGFWEGLFCNKDLFDQYSLDLPTTWDKFITAIHTFQSNDIIPVSASLKDVPHYWIEFLILTASGSKEYSIVPESAPKDWIKGLNMLRELRNMKVFPDDTISKEDSELLFKNKKAAMHLNGSWFLGGIPDQENTVVCAFPIMNGGKAHAGSIVGGISSGFYITKKAWDDPNKREAAVQFVMAHTSKEGVQKYWEAEGATAQAACAVDPIDTMTPLAVSGLEYSKSAYSISAPIDSRLSQKAYNSLIYGIIDLVQGKIQAEDLINKALTINASRTQ